MTWEDKFDSHPMRTSAVWIIAAVMFIFLLCWLVVAASFGLRVATAGLVGRGEAHIAIQSGSNRIAQYNKFFNICASVQSLEDRIDQQTEALKQATNPVDQQRIRDNLAGIRGLRSEAINQYNADASKDYTDGQFRASKLPYQLPTASYPEGGKTSCAY